MAQKPTKSDCNGCHNDFYNDHNPYGVKECWLFKSAEMVNKLDIPVDMRLPYNHLKPTLRPNCYKRQRECRVDPSVLTKDGFWKS